jgi:hypothetical protein
MKKFGIWLTTCGQRLADKVGKACSLGLLLAVLTACGGSAQPNSNPTATLPATPAVFKPLSESTTQFSGRIFYTQNSRGVFVADLKTNQNKTYWEMPVGGFLSGLSGNPVDSTLALAYSPNPGEGKPQLGLTSLYLLAPNQTEPQPLLLPTVQFETFSSPQWSPDGKWLYFSHYAPVFDAQGNFSSANYEIARIAPPDLTIETVLVDAEQPSFSADGSRMVYVKIDPATYTQSLWAANADGSDAHELLPMGAFAYFNSPTISPDGQNVLVGGSGPYTPGATPQSVLPRQWWEPAVAEAHGPPWDIWKIPFAGGVPQKVSDLANDSPAVTYSPDGKMFAVLQPGAVLLMLDGQPPLLVTNAVEHGEIVWLAD